MKWSMQQIIKNILRMLSGFLKVTKIRDQGGGAALCACEWQMELPGFVSNLKGTYVSQRKRPQKDHTGQ